MNGRSSRDDVSLGIVMAMEFNPEKCELVHFGKSNAREKYTGHPSYSRIPFCTCKVRNAAMIHILTEQLIITLPKQPAMEGYRPRAGR